MINLKEKIIKATTKELQKNRNYSVHNYYNCDCDAKNKRRRMNIENAIKNNLFDSIIESTGYLFVNNTVTKWAVRSDVSKIFTAFDSKYEKNTIFSQRFEFKLKEKEISHRGRLLIKNNNFEKFWREKGFKITSNTQFEAF